jgi:hypothetical protein
VRLSHRANYRTSENCYHRALQGFDTPKYFAYLSRWNDLSAFSVDVLAFNHGWRGLMGCARNAGLGILAAFLFTTGTICNGQTTNPLYQHRQAVRSPSLQAPVTISCRALSPGANGHVVLDTRSSTLLGAGIRSGDPVNIELASGTLLAHAAFRDEVDRSARYHAETGQPYSLDVGITLIVDRSNPVAPVLIDTSAGQSTMSLDIAPGQSLTIRLPLSLPGGGRAG